MRGNRMFDPSRWLPKRRLQRSRRSWVVASGDDVIDELPDLHPEAQQFVQMDPKEYLRLTLPPGRTYKQWLGIENIVEIENRMREGRPVDIGWLAVDLGTNRVIGHNGRARAAAAMRARIQSIPVAVFVFWKGRFVENGGAVDLARYPECRVDMHRGRFVPQFDGKEGADVW